MQSTFAELGVPADFANHLAGRGITAAFPIQTLALPPALDGRDVAGRAPTGSGKTLAFGVAVADRVGRAEPRRPRALILAPTRELATQISDELAPLLALRRRRIATFFGGVGFGNQLQQLKRGVDVAVACPGRLNDLLQRGELKLSDVEIVVVDEADRMADMGFLPEVRRILDKVRPDRQTMLFSATLDGAVDVLVRNYQRDPVRCEIAPTDETSDPNVHHWVRATRNDRVAMTAELVSHHGSTIVFCRTKHGADRVAKQLYVSGVKAVAIHGNRTQGQRERALAAFAGGKAQALVATDVAARGIHVDDVACVVHFDVPADAKDYLHRSGRTGRAGATGVVVSLVTDEDVDKVRKLRKALGVAPDADDRGSHRGQAAPVRSARPRASRNRQGVTPPRRPTTASPRPRGRAGATGRAGRRAPRRPRG